MTARDMRERLHKQGLAAIPYKLAVDGKLSDSDVRLALALADRAEGRGYCRPTNSGLAALLNCADRKIRRGLASLAAAGWIAFEYQHDPPLADRIIVLNWPKPTPELATDTGPAVQSLTVLRVDNFVQETAETTPESRKFGQKWPPDKRTL